MSPDQHAEVQDLSKSAPPFDTMADSLRRLQVGEGTPTDKENIWLFYWPIVLGQAFDFFSDDEEARNATLGFMERWLLTILGYEEEKAKLITFQQVTARNYFIDVQRKLDLGPVILYGTETDEMDDDNDRTEVVTYTEEYPFDGIDTNDPETLAIKREEEQGLGTRLDNIRDTLYPGDQPVYDLLLEDYNSDDIASILERSTKAVSRSIDRIRDATKNGG